MSSDEVLGILARVKELERTTKEMDSVGERESENLGRAVDMLNNLAAIVNKQQDRLLKLEAETKVLLEHATVAKAWMRIKDKEAEAINEL